MSDPRLARTLDEWAEVHAEWLDLGETRDWNAARTALANPREGEPMPHALALADILVEVLGFGDFDAALLRLIVAMDRLPRAAALARLLSVHGRDLPGLLGELAGAASVDADRAVRRSAVVRLGLVTFRTNSYGPVEVELRWTLERLIDRAAADCESVVAALVGSRQVANLTLDDFGHVPDADFLVRLLSGAGRMQAAGINILVHGPPGTGKTEFARALATVASLGLHSVGEADDDGDEPNRHERVSALQLAQRVMAPVGGAVLLFDEMEDLIGDARPSGGDWVSGRQGSKVFINRLLETNALGNVDAAIVRRMSFVLKLDLPSPNAAHRMLARIASEEGVAPEAGIEGLLDQAPETTTVHAPPSDAGPVATDRAYR